MLMYQIYMFTSLESRKALSLRLKAPLAFPHKACPQLKNAKRAFKSVPLTHGQKESAVKIKERLTNDKNGQIVKRYIKYGADTTEIKGCNSLQPLYWFNNEALRSVQLFI